MPCIIRARDISQASLQRCSHGINSGASRTMNLHRPYAPSAASSPLRSIASLLSHSTPCICDPCVERCLLLPPVDSSPLAFWPQRANAASQRPRCLVGIKRRSSSQCLVRLRPLSTLFHSSFQRASPISLLFGRIERCLAAAPLAEGQAQHPLYVRTCRPSHRSLFLFSWIHPPTQVSWTWNCGGNF